LNGRVGLIVNRLGSLPGEGRGPLASVGCLGGSGLGGVEQVGAGEHVEDGGGGGGGAGAEGLQPRRAAREVAQLCGEIEAKDGEGLACLMESYCNVWSMATTDHIAVHACMLHRERIYNI
jgi:hypothetical protein